LISDVPDYHLTKNQKAAFINHQSEIKRLTYWHW